MTAIRRNSLAKLSDSQLLRRLDNLARKERQTTLEVLRHIIEMDHRKLYLGRGYASLYEYCTRHLGYSESAAFRRIQTARCIRDFPDVRDMLLKNELNLTTVSKLAGIMTDENKITLLKEARHKSTRQIEAIVARYHPRRAICDRVRTVFIKSYHDKPEAESEPKIESLKNNNEQGKHPNQKNSSPDNWGKFTSGAGGKKLDTCRDTRTRQPVLEQKYKLEFAVNPAFMKKLEEAKALLSTKYPRGLSFEQLFEVVLDEYVNKHNPKRKEQRRQKRKANNNSKLKDKKIAVKTSQKGLKKLSRHIPAAVQDRVLKRDKGRCTYVGVNGVRCNSTWNLQIDHVKPYAEGGDHSIGNLRLLCAGHNQYEAERTYGREFMSRQVQKKFPKRE
jgi:5-methylcytosine-specific restriction endonuclease McrA